MRGTRRIGFEWKRAEAPDITPSMRIAMQDLRLDKRIVVHGGKECWPMGERIRAVAAARMLEEIEPLD